VVRKVEVQCKRIVVRKRKTGEETVFLDGPPLRQIPLILRIEGETITIIVDKGEVSEWPYTFSIHDVEIEHERYYKF